MNIDVRNVVWLGTSNIGHDLIFEYHDSLKHTDQIMTRVEYVELMSRLRPRVSDRLGVSTRVVVFFWQIAEEFVSRRLLSYRV